MTYHIATSLTDRGYYICLSEDMKYFWFNNFIDLLTRGDFDDDNDDNLTCKEWLKNLPTYGMQYLFSFTEEDKPHLQQLYPEYFI